MAEEYVKVKPDNYSFFTLLQYYGSGSDYYTPSWRYLPYQSTLNGVRLPSWKNRIALGISATTYMVGELKEIREYTPGRFVFTYYQWVNPKLWHEQYYRDGAIWAYPSSALVFPSTASISTTAADNQAKVKFVKRARSTQSSMSLGVTGGEIRETLRFIRSPLRGLHRSLNDYMKLVKKRARERRYVKRRNLDKKIRENLLNRMVAGTWLETQMAILPLMGEVRSGAEALARIAVNVERKLVRIKATGREELYSKTLNPAGGWSNFFRDLYESTTLAEVTYIGAVKVRMPEKNRALSALEKLGLMPKDFLPTVWELIPGSFLLDYVYNVDDVISAATFSQANFAWVQRTVRRSATRTVTLLDDKQGRLASIAGLLNEPARGERYGWYDFVSPRCVLLSKSVSRNVFEGSLVPDFTVNVPSSAKKWANIAGLLLVQKRTIEALR